MRGSEHATAGRSFGRRAGCFELGLPSVESEEDTGRHGAVSHAREGNTSCQVASVTQQVPDTWHMRSLSMRNLSNFVPKSSKIHNFRIRAPFLTFFICTRS